MSDNDPHPDQPYRGRRRAGRERDPGPDPLTDPSWGGAARGTSTWNDASRWARDPGGDPGDEPWPPRPVPRQDPGWEHPSAPGVAGWDAWSAPPRGRGGTHPEDAWRGDPRAPGGPDPRGGHRPEPEPDPDRPRGRRRRSETGADPDTGAHGFGAPDPSRLPPPEEPPRRGRRHRRAEEPTEAGPAGGRRRGERAPGDGEDPTRARPEGRRPRRAAADRGEAPGPRRRGAAAGAAAAGEDAREYAPAPESDDMDSGAPPRRRRRPPADQEPAPRTRRSRRPEPEEDDEDEPPRRRRRGEGAGAPRRRTRSAPPRKRSASTRRRERRRARLLMATAAGALVLVLIGGYVVVRGYLFPPDYDGRGNGEVEITISKGETGSAIAETLEDKDVVASSQAFLNALDDGAADNLTPGTYRLRAQMSGEAAVALLLDPASRVGVKLTVKEGLRSDQILKLIAEKTDIPLEELKTAYEDTDPAALGLPDYATQGPEGYLFPDTYTISPKDSAGDVLKRMTRRFDQVAKETDLEKGAEKRGFDPNEIMAMAAVVQAESGSAEDMPKVARVIYNRLDQNMELGMDSTCFYVIDEYGIALTNSQLQACKQENSDYATYGRKGLPAGPIVSPGEDAIKAALKPAEGDWLYFVATDPENGVTKFAETHEEFEQLKAEFEANRGGS